MASTQMQRYPVSADFVGGDEWSTPGLSFDDYSRMSTQTRKQSGERRLPTPSWAVNRKEQQEILAVYLERRVRIQPGKGTYRQRLGRAETILKRKCKGHIAVLDKLCEEYVALKKAEPTAPRLRRLENLIEGLDTRIRLEQSGFGKTVAGVIYYYYNLCLDSVGVAEQLKIKPPQVRQILFEMHKTWDKCHAREQNRQQRAARSKMFWVRRNAGLTARGRDPRVVGLYLSGMKVPDIAVAVGYKPGNGHFVIRARLREAGVWKREPYRGNRLATGRPPLKIDVVRAVKLRKQGLTYKVIAQSLGVSQATVCNTLRKAAQA